jgi:hypothetical protein
MKMVPIHQANQYWKSILVGLMETLPQMLYKVCGIGLCLAYEIVRMGVGGCMWLEKIISVVVIASQACSLDERKKL